MTKIKIFLSHSSSDKAIVRRIYEELGASLCHYDEATFDPSGSISEEIRAALNDSTHFVLFASPTAIQSPWVQGELARAFENWMRTGIRKAMVFLLHGAELSDLPSWLHSYIMREPPTYRHILCRIQSEIDKDRRNKSAPPFYRPNELQRLETKILVEAAEMPGAILVHGPDGSGRKSLLNELYSRQFPGVAARKLHIKISAYAGERELYRDLVGLTTIATPSEFGAIFDAFDSLSTSEKRQSLIAKIDECTKGNQCVLIEGDNSLLTEEGSIPEWLTDLLVSLSGKDYPRIALTTLRRPAQLPANTVDKLIIQEVSELDRKDSALLFNWWLRELDSTYVASLRETVFDACAGSPRQLELGAKLLVQEGAGNVAKIRPHLLKTLEGLSRQLLDALAGKQPHATLLSFVANAGHITRSDLTQYAMDSQVGTIEILNEAIAECASYGFFVEDEVCIRLPEYLVRGARAMARSGKTEENIKALFRAQGERSEKFAIDDLTTISVLNEHCLATLRSGTNVGTLFESIILPSQCLQVARAMYEKEEYEKTHSLCSRAYEARAALSNDGLIETLRYMGLSAARMGDRDRFKQVLAYFDEELDGSRKGYRILHFLKGFNERLDGNYDGALVELIAAHRTHGEHDIHILRELAFISVHTGNVTAARGYINSALARASSNHYVLELAARIELHADPATVSKRSEYIESLLDKLQAFDTSPDKIYWLQAKCEFYLALNEPETAKSVLESSPVSYQQSPVIELLRARVLMKLGRHGKATEILGRLFHKASEQRTGQRKSILPIVCRSLVEASGADSPLNAIDWFWKCKKYLPRQIASVQAKQLLEAAAFDQTKLSDSSRKQLEAAANGT